MLRFTGKLQNESEEELEELKKWLFSEQIRLDEKEKEIQDLLRRFEEEKKQFKLDMRSISRRLQVEKERLLHEQQLIDKKQEILESAFKELDSDRKKLEREKAKVETEKRFYERENKEFMAREMSPYMSETIYFKGITNLVALRKRYKDLMKVYHPDNLTGDHDTLILIGNEYEFMKKKLAQSGSKEA